MKLMNSLVVLLALTFSGFAQNTLYVKYEADVEASGEDSEMMAMMMQGSTMEIAANGELSWVKTQMGTMMTMTMLMDVDGEEMTMLMEGMMGVMAFQGDPKKMTDEKEEEAEVDLELLDETKKILGYKCKKAIITNEDGSQSTFWYTEKFERPEGMNKMPNAIPGLCLEMQMNSGEGLKITYTATEVDEDADPSIFEIIIPEDVEVMSIEDLNEMGMGGM